MDNIDVYEAIRALYDPIRFEIVKMLQKRDMYGAELAATLILPEPTVSYQMRILCESELVSSRKEGRRKIYSLNSESARIMVETLAEYLNVDSIY
ncbi:MAG: metalloregulator ArsR/SmtB family transcription factor [Eubacteriales bacterium]|nr:metalloregulator ArsR/SmtB family transcription factor [Eubacteriales bacterium]